MSNNLINKKIGDMVYVDCYSSMGAFSCGDLEITHFTYKYDEDTGEKYKIIHTGDTYDGRKWDSRTGESIPEGMFYIQ